MRQTMRCSIHALNIVMGGAGADARTNPAGLDKFLSELVNYHCRQLGYVTDTRLMLVMIPEDKREAMIHVLSTTWGAQHRSFTLAEAAKLLGTLVSLFFLPMGHLSVYEPISCNVQVIRKEYSPTYELTGV